MQARERQGCYLSSMSMRWDPLLAAAFAAELDARLRKARVRALHLDGESRQVHLFLRDATLVFELHPREGWVSLLDPAEPFPDAIPMPARIRGVSALEDESALVLDIQRIRGRGEGWQLYVEWIGNRWNAAAVGHRSGTIQHVLTSRKERTRELAVGAAYAPPPSTGRAGVDGELDSDIWNEILAQGGPSQKERRRALLSGVAWTSSLNVELFLEGDGLAEWREVRDPDRWAAFLVEAPAGPRPYPIPLPPAVSVPFPGLIEAMSKARAAWKERLDDEGGPEDRLGSERMLLLPPGLVDRVREKISRSEAKSRGLRRELERAPDPRPVRARGDLILARFGEIPRGEESVTVLDFEGVAVEIELDPTLEPQGNAKRHYDEAARLERARRELPSRIRNAEEETLEWIALLEGLESGQMDPAEGLRRLGPDPARRRTGAARGPSLPYRRFRSSGGLEIRVGRGSKQNDELTFRHSAPDDVWLHTRQAPGAHVILRWTAEGNPPRRDLVEAATLAALHSEARHSGSVPVDWTRRKYVRKPRKAPAGSVIPSRVETLFVAPDPDLPDRLRPPSGAERPSS